MINRNVSFGPNRNKAQLSPQGYHQSFTCQTNKYVIPCLFLLGEINKNIKTHLGKYPETGTSIKPLKLNALARKHQGPEHLSRPLTLKKLSGISESKNP